MNEMPIRPRKKNTRMSLSLDIERSLPKSQRVKTCLFPETDAFTTENIDKIMIDIKYYKYVIRCGDILKLRDKKAFEEVCKKLMFGKNINSLETMIVREFVNYFNISPPDNYITLPKMYKEEENTYILTEWIIFYSP
jgi:hypothetical protein